MASKSNGIEASDWARAPPVSGSVWQRALKAIYNPEEKSFLGRTAKRWGIMLTFYMVFYAVLALLFALCMGGLFLSLDKHRPTYTLQRSLIGANPGVASRPRPTDGATIKYDINNETHYQDYVQQLKEFLQPYRGDMWYAEQNVCNANESYGFPLTPCFLIKLNRIFDWMPDYYEDDKLPADAPEDLLEYIQSLEPYMRRQIWVSCWEERGNGTRIGYPWGRGMPARYYPFTHAAGYRSPLVAVRLAPPVNKQVAIRCRAWADNIIYDKSIKAASGYTRILLHLEDKTQGQTE